MTYFPIILFSIIICWLLFKITLCVFVLFVRLDVYDSRFEYAPAQSRSCLNYWIQLCNLNKQKCYLIESPKAYSLVNPLMLPKNDDLNWNYWLANNTDEDLRLFRLEDEELEDDEELDELLFALETFWPIFNGLKFIFETSTMAVYKDLLCWILANKIGRLWSVFFQIPKTVVFRLIYNKRAYNMLLYSSEFACVSNFNGKGLSWTVEVFEGPMSS